MIDAVPRLETDRLLLRSWSDDDTAAYARIVGDAEVMRYMGSGLRYRIMRAAVTRIGLLARIEARRRIVHLVDHWRRWGYGEWAIEEKRGGAMVGQVGLVHHADWSADEANVEVGWMLARPLWGRGFASEGARAALAYAFDRLDLKRVVSITRPQNHRSQRVMERAGLSFAGRTIWKGEEVVWYAIDRAAWRDLQVSPVLHHPFGRSTTR
jgi:RimJ/RimL family protein N-acetyltransferase